MDAAAHEITPPEGAPVKDLDVRPLLAAGTEPFGAIMEAVETLGQGEVLVLRAPFDPRPLHNVLGKRGFAKVSRELAPDDWEVRYWRPEVLLDVRGLEPPEPMERTLAALEELPAGAVLLHVNDRVPAFLLPELDDRGFTYTIDRDDRGVLVRITAGAPS
ncbi:MAG: DUF2249 domain-containing protein [Thermoleophilia bacterium]|nr:DUF2249 domain-containing protein [Thermoleophilia bacterium]